MNISLLISVVITIAVPIFALYMLSGLDLFGTARRRTMIVCFVWGIIAFGLSYVMNTMVLNFLVSLGVPRSDAYEFIVRFFAPILEETVKALFLVYLIRQPSFRFFVDGGIYGFCIGFGFATVENLFYLNNNPGAALGLSATRALSTLMMHGMTTAIVGISLGMLRRSTQRIPITPLLGILVAMSIHLVYNNIVNALSGVGLLIVAIAIGLGGAAFIAYLIRIGMQQEKLRIAQVLKPKPGAVEGVSEGEAMAIGRFGDSSSQLVTQLSDSFGDENVALIRKLLITQANIGILKNNLISGQASPRLRSAWEAEIAEREAEYMAIRFELDRSVMSYFKALFPSEDESLWQWLLDSLAKDDPTMINKFDHLMRQTGLAAELTPEEIEAMAERLSQIEIFREVKPADLENLGRSIKTLTFQAGEMLFDQGDEGDAMYMIVEGAIDIFSVNNGVERPLRTFGPGQVVGDFAVFDGQKRSARARASQTNTLTALVLQREMFRMFIQSRPKVILSVLKVLGEKARFTTASVEQGVRSLRELSAGNYQAVAEAPTPAVQTATMPAASSAALSEEAAPAPAQVAATLARLASTLQGHGPEPLRPAGQTNA